MRTYAHFGQLCAELSPTASWIHTMDRRSGEPALFCYAVNAACVLATGRPAIVAEYQRSADGVVVIPTERQAPVVAGACVSLMMRFMERRMTLNGEWRRDLLQTALAAFPEVGHAAVGDSISPAMAGLWALPMLRGGWMPAPQLEQAPEMGVTYVSSR